MKNFRFLSYALIVGATTLALPSCDKDDDDLAVTTTGVEALVTLPNEARSILSSVQGASVSSTKTFSTISERGTKYESYVVLNNAAVELEFDSWGNWVDVETTNTISIPENLLIALQIPQALLDNLKQANANLQIQEVERLPYGYQVELFNDREFVFDFAGTLLQQQGLGSISNRPVVPASSVNTTAKAFIDTHFSGYTVQLLKQETEYGRTEYKYYIVSGLKGYKLSFDTNYSWLEVEGDDDRAIYVPQSVLSLLPAALQNYLSSNFARLSVVSVDKELNTYEVELSNDTTLYFDLNGNILRTDYDD